VNLLFPQILADEALNIRARREFRAEFVALAGIERPDEQGAEDGWLNAGPTGACGSGEHFQLPGGEREGAGVFEEPAIEAGDFLEQERGILGAGGHILPQGGNQHGEATRAFLHFFEQVLEAVFREQADVFGEHGEEAALEESGDDLRVVAIGFEGLRQGGEAAGDGVGDLGGELGGIERMGIEPDGAEAVADFLPVEVRQGDAVRDGIGETLVLAAGAGEFGVEDEFQQICGGWQGGTWRSKGAVIEGRNP